jgi:hypothetical protein
VIGTMPDAGFTFNALGMFTIAFPDVSVIFSIDAKLFQRPGLPAEDGAAPGAGLNLLGIVAIDSSAVKVGVRGSYTVPQVLVLQVPFGGFFPVSPPGDPWVRIGADGVEGRTGDTVTLQLLPTSLNLRVWAFLMIEARQLHRLGGVASFNLDGFSIGFGAGFELRYGGSAIGLRVAAKILVGFGTKPLTAVGGIFIEGELKLLVVSVSVSGEITATITETHQVLHGRFCGRVDFFFFSVSGCVDIALGSGPAPGIPTPDHPVTRVDLTDRRGTITGRAARAGAPPDPKPLPNTVWPDTVPLVQFSTYVQNRLAGSPFAPSPAELPGPQWSGSSELKYAYRLTGLDLVRVDGPGAGPVAGPLESVWWWPTHRRGVLDPADPAPTGHEGRQLALLSWYPAPWSRTLTDGGAGTPGDPAGTVGNLCVPTPVATRTCALGQNAERVALDGVTLRPDGPGSGPLPSYFEVLGRERGAGVDYDEYVAALAALGLHVVPARLEAFGGPVAVPKEGPPVTGAWGISYVARETTFLGTLEFVGTLSPNLDPASFTDNPTITLAICDRGDRPQAAGRRCDDFADLKPGAQVPNPLVRAGVEYRWRNGLPSPTTAPTSPVVDFVPTSGPDRRAELWTGNGGLLVTLPGPVRFVEVAVAFFFGPPMTVIALDAAGKEIARATAPDVRDTVHTLRVSAIGIRAVQIQGGTAVDTNSVSPRTAGVLLQLCYDAEPAPLFPNFPELLPVADEAFPRIVGTTSAGLDREWTPEPIGVVGDARCRLVRYRAPRAGAWNRFRNLPWSRFRVLPFAGGHVRIVSVCGVEWQTALIARADELARPSMAAQINLHAVAGALERRHLLQSNAQYEIRVRCQWRGWRKSEAQPTPPPLDDTGWADFPEQVHAFRTAAAAALPPNPPPFEFRDETTFDVRAVNRYLRKFWPDGSGAPHFLDDPLAVDFDVDHLEQLLALYGRALVLKLRRTDPPPASLTGFVRPPDLPIVVSLKPLALAERPIADQRVVAVALAAPCLQPPNIGGATLEVTAAMERGAEYDLLLTAPPSGSTASDQVTVARTHFRTSRYRNPAEVLAALGFRSPAPYPIVPMDAFVTTPTLVGTVTANDGDFQTALVTMGLDRGRCPSSRGASCCGTVPRSEATSLPASSSRATRRSSGAPASPSRTSPSGRRCSPCAARTRRARASCSYPRRRWRSATTRSSR